MAFTRKFLEAMGIEEKQVEEIMASHLEVVNALKEQRDTYKTDADKLEKVQKELDDLKAKPENNNEEIEKLQKKYDDLDKQYKEYKSGVEAKESKAKKESAKRKILQDAGVSDKYLDLIMKASAEDTDTFEFEEDGKVKDADAKKEAYKKTYADFIEVKETGGIKTPTPPSNGGSTPTTSRASELFKQHSEQMYGKAKED